jgi:hypothetical protein
MSDPNQPPEGDPFAPPPEGVSGAQVPGIPNDPPAYGTPAAPPPPPPAVGTPAPMPPAPPAYGAAQPYAATPGATVPNNMGLAIAALVAGLCCSGIFGLVTGILAVVQASSVKNKVAQGDIAGATEAARKARLFSFISFGLAALGIVVSIILVATGTFTSSVSTN